MMSRAVVRGYSPNDKKEFSEQSMKNLLQAKGDLRYLLNNGYNIKGAATFVGNHYMFSERQRLALIRAVSSDKSIQMRKAKEIKDFYNAGVVNIDGFNTIITLEVALSNSLLLRCMDGTIRDLAAMRGTYRLIDKTETAILMIGKILESNEVNKAVFYLDAPVSNSGRLKQRIIELLSGFHFEVQVEVIHHVDTVLEKLENVITSDAIILDRCKSWINLNKMIIEDSMKGYPYVDFFS